MDNMMNVISFSKVLLYLTSGKVIFCQMISLMLTKKVWMALISIIKNYTQERITLRKGYISPNDYKKAMNSINYNN